MSLLQLMNAVGRSIKSPTREAVGYEANPPACRNCRHVRDRSKPHIWCAKHRFGVKPHAVCDHWHGRDGSTLEGEKP